ncbi:MAG: potassium channel protein [Candidatus Melainabacteria bacterium HGW-Melainabacteria-1]|nr:MAG: potassium channel protein [Candidatus Melainabacteria bacterium HGW-Melainabacteria-1]
MKRHLKSHGLDLRLLWQELQLPFSLLFITFVGGTLGYKLLYPDLELHRLFFMTAITLSTVGYGDVVGAENSPLAAWYTMVLMLVGMGTSVYAVSTLTAFFVEGALGELLKYSKLKRRIAGMREHYIICGAGTTGVHIIREMSRCGVNFVVLDQSEERLHELREEFPNLLFIADDATDEASLAQAGIHLASGLVAALTNDKENLFLTLTARQMNPRLKIVSKAIDLNIGRRLEIAGADYIVSPNFIGGMRMASEMLRPNVVSFLDRMLRGHENDIRIHEVTLPIGSSQAGKCLGELEVFLHTGVRILAMLDSPQSSQYVYNPDHDHKLAVGTVLLFIGNTAQQRKLIDLVK